MILMNFLKGTRGKGFMTNQPDYIKCIQHTHTERKKTSWCGKSLSSFDWVFQDIDHAAYSTMS
jgi:hypothetical protein